MDEQELNRLLQIEKTAKGVAESWVGRGDLLASMQDLLTLFGIRDPLDFVSDPLCQEQ